MSAPLFATGMAPDKSLRLQVALSQLLGRTVGDDEDVADTLIAAVHTVNTRLTVLETVCRDLTGLPE